MSTLQALNSTRNKGGAPIGNKNAVKNRPRFIEWLVKASKSDDHLRVLAAAQKLLDKAAEGEPWAIQMLADRLDGKAFQAIELTGEEGGPIQISARPTLTAAMWLATFAPGVPDVIEGQAQEVKQLEEKK